MAHPLPSADYLRRIFIYDPDTGHLCRRRRDGTVSETPVAAGQASAKHRLVSIDDRRYLIHRIVWKIATGKDPTEVIDHIDGNPLNNKLDNLREADWSQNRMNSALSCRNKSGVKGVFQVQGRWRGVIAINRKNVVLGHFSSIEEAASAVAAARLKHHAEFCRFS